MELDKRKIDYFFDSEDAKERLNSFLQDRDCYPLHVVIHPTMACNHRCNFCNYFHNIDSYEREDHQFKSISLKEISILLEDFERLKVNTVVISGGGDPLAHRDIKAILERTMLFSFTKHIYTNLDFDLDDETISLLSKLDSLNINVNTFDPVLYRELRGKQANLSRVIRNLKYLTEQGANLRAVVVVKDDTIDSVQRTLDLLLNHDITKIVISPAFELAYADGTGISDTSIQKLVNFKNTNSNTDIKFLRQVEEAVFEESGNSYCRTHYFDITIGADYFVYPCCLTAYREEYRLVNLKEFKSFEDAWNSNARKSTINSLDFKCSICWFGKANQYLKTIGVD